MKKNVLFLMLTFLFAFTVFSQKSEYRYLAIRFGAIHGFNPAPVYNESKYLTGKENQQMRLSPTGSLYVPGFSFAFLYHFDFVTNNAGIITGIEYDLGGTGGKYETVYESDIYKYNMKETYRYQSVGIPLAFKVGPDLWDKQRYLYAGAKVNFLVSMKAVEKVDWTKSVGERKLTSEEFNRVGFNLFAGVNFLAFNVQFDFYPQTFFNRTYTDASGKKSYAGEPEKAFALRTTINVPYGWLSEQSFWWRKLLRGTFWK